MDSREVSVAALAALLDGTVEGDGAHILRRVATLESAEDEALAWLGHEKYLSQLATTRAGAVLVPVNCPRPPGKTIIRVADPDLALCTALERLGPPVPRVAPGVDPRASVAADAQVEGAAIGPHVFVGPRAIVGRGTQLHPGVYIGQDARVGRDCVLWPNVVVRERCTLGDRVIVHPNATLGADGFGYLFRNGKHHKVPQIGVVTIEDDVEIGAGTAIDRAKSGVTRIGRGTKIDNLVQVAHNCDIGEDCIIVALAAIGGSCSFGRHVIIGGQAGVSDHVALGEGVHLAAQSGVYKDLPPGGIFGGTPAVDSLRWGKQSAALKRLPELLHEFRDLVKRIERLEAEQNARPRGET